MSMNYFQGTTKSPYHISIGAVVRNEEGKILCHYFKSISRPGSGTLENFYLLMRETIEPGESIETCLARGLFEEFGMTGEIESYLGSIVSHFPKDDVIVEKTTLYFLCKPVSFDELQRKADDPERESELVLMNVADLIEKMKEQRTRLQREDIDESVVLERL